MRQYKPTSCYTGVSHIELMMAITFIAILTTATIPSVSSILQRQTLIGSSNILLTDLNFSRQTAVSYSSRVIICPVTPIITTRPQCTEHNQWNHGWMVFVDTNRNASLDDEETVLRINQLDNSLDINSRGRRYFRFDPDGTSLGLPGSIIVCLQKTQNQHNHPGNRIIVSNVGRIRAEPAGSHCD